MPNVDFSKFEAMSGADLENHRVKLMEKNKNIKPIDWDLDDLSEMAAVVGVIRRKSSGPPKAKATTAKPKKEKASLDDLL